MNGINMAVRSFGELMEGVELLSSMNSSILFLRLTNLPSMTSSFCRKFSARYGCLGNGPYQAKLLILARRNKGYQLIPSLPALPVLPYPVDVRLRILRHGKFTTCDMSLMSRSLAATSVATKTSTLPSLNFLKTDSLGLREIPVHCVSLMYRGF